MRKFRSFIYLLCLVSSACDSDSSNPTSVWSVTKDANHVRLTDLDSGQFLQDFSISSSLTSSIVKAGGAIWLGTKDGQVLRMNMSSGQIEATLPVSNLMFLYAQGSQLWAAQYPNQLVQIDPSSNKQIRSLSLATIADPIAALEMVDDVLFVLVSNEFSIYKVDTKTGSVLGSYSINSGKYGYGNMTIKNGIVYIIDRYNGRLITMNESFGAVTSVSIDAGLGSSMVATPVGVFAASGSGKYYQRIDGASLGTVVSLKGSPIQMIFKDNRLVFSYSISTSFGTLSEVDPASGTEIKTFTGVYADGLLTE